MKSLKNFKYGWIIPNVDMKKGKNSHFWWDNHQGNSFHIGIPYLNMFIDAWEVCHQYKKNDTKFTIKMCIQQLFLPASRIELLFLDPEKKVYIQNLWQRLNLFYTKVKKIRFVFFFHFFLHIMTIFRQFEQPFCIL